MPGTQNLHVYDAFHRHGDSVSHFLIRNEQAATLMANGFSRASGEVGAALTVPGPGATNASTGIGDAYTDCVSVLLITGGCDRKTAGRDRSKMFHGLDQQRLFEPITRYYGCPQSCEEIPEIVESAFRAMFSGRPGPAVIEMPPVWRRPNVVPYRFQIAFARNLPTDCRNAPICHPPTVRDVPLPPTLAIVSSAPSRWRLRCRRPPAAC